MLESKNKQIKKWINKFNRYYDLTQTFKKQYNFNKIITKTDLYLFR